MEWVRPFKERGLVRDVLSIAIEDWVFEDLVMSIVNDHTELSGDVLRHATIGLIAELLERGLIFDHFLSAPASMPVGDAIQRLTREWYAKRERTSFIDIVWFGPTQRAFDEVREVAEREGWVEDLPRQREAWRSDWEKLAEQ